MAAADKTQTLAETSIRDLIDRWAKALHDKDVDRIMSIYASDVRVFDLAPPLQTAGAHVHRKNFQEWFSSFRGPIGSDIRDLGIEAGEDVAFCHGLNRISGMRTSGEETDVWVRVTVGFRKTNGAWKVTHEHVSVPFYMDGSYKAAVDLMP
jgi:ketosteroid isomerase-like protein